MLPFLSPKSDLSSLTTPSAETVVLEVDRWWQKHTLKLWWRVLLTHSPFTMMTSDLDCGLMIPDFIGNWSETRFGSDLSGTMTGPDQLWGTYPLAPLWRYRPRSLSSPGRGWAVRQTRTSERQNIERKLKTRRWVQTYSSVSTGLLENSVVKNKTKTTTTKKKLKSVLCCSVPQVLKSLFIFCPDQNTQ